MVSALVPRSSKAPGETFPHPESRGIISNLIMITELFYLHNLSITRSSLHTRFFRSINRSVFRYRFTKIWLPCGAFEKRAPGRGH